MAPKPRLGRGLNALIAQRIIPPFQTAVNERIEKSDSKTPPISSENNIRIYEVLIDQIDENPNQPRKTMDSAALEELTNSIRTHGILQPVLLKQVADRYELVAGHRRTAAAKNAGLSTVPAIIRQNTTPEQQIEWALVENIQRQDLNAIERAKAYRAYIERFSLTHSQAAERLGEDRTTITNFLRLLELPGGIQDLLTAGAISTGHAKVLAGIDDSERQISLAALAAQQGLSVRRLETLALESGAAAPRLPKSGSVRTPNVLDMEQRLSRQLGTKIRIIPGRKKGAGKVVIQYFSVDEFQRIFGQFTTVEV
ncbi:MAG: ParB/RepB/Spo0J family partition protein [Phycisphaerae bacterium]